MKRYILWAHIICLPTYALYTHQPIKSRPTFDDYKEAIIRARTKKNPAQQQWLLALAAALGSASGYLCRHVEQKVLCDLLPLRLLNLIIWGAAQESLIQTVAQDVHAPNQKLFAKIAWLASWVSYFMHG